MLSDALLSLFSPPSQLFIVPDTHENFAGKTMWKQGTDVTKIGSELRRPFREVLGKTCFQLSLNVAVDRSMRDFVKPSSSTEADLSGERRKSLASPRRYDLTL